MSNALWKPQPGVYLNLPDWKYHAAEAIGSSDMRTLLRDPATWWYDSAFNPNRFITAKKKSNLEAGLALHTLILEGEKAYERRFAFAPDEQNAGQLANTALEIKNLLIDKGVDFDHKTWNKAALIKLARKHGWAHLVYDCARLDFEQAHRSGRAAITPQQDSIYRHMAELIKQDPDFGPALDEEVGLTEVSVFWYREDDPETLLRARFDKMLLQATVDLKSMAGRDGQSPEDIAEKHIYDYEYDIQRRLYHEGRQMFSSFVHSGQVFACYQDDDIRAEPRILPYNSPSPNPLAPFAENEDWQWVWIFYQVRSDQAGAARAPVVLPLVHKPEGEIFNQAGDKIDVALENFRFYRSRFGLEEPWSIIKPMREVDDEDLKRLRYKGVPA